MCLPNIDVGFLSPEEEFPMTMQIVMHTQHGLVFAGDTKQYSDVSNGRWTRRRSFNGSKITMGECKDVFVARARNMEDGQIFVDTLLSELKGKSPLERGKTIADIGDRLAQPDPSGFEFLIAFANPASFYHLIIQPDGVARCFGGRDNATAGDSANQACFIAERCFSKDCSVNQMVSIGAQVVRMASRFSNGTIDGLEIVTLSGEQFREWQPPEIAELEASTKRRLDAIENIILNGVS